MRKYRFKLLLLSLIFYSEYYTQYGKINIDSCIRDAKVFQTNQLTLLPALISFKDFDEALNKKEKGSSYYHSFNGNWKFSLENTRTLFNQIFTLNLLMILGGKKLRFLLDGKCRVTSILCIETRRMYQKPNTGILPQCFYEPLHFHGAEG